MQCEIAVSDRQRVYKGVPVFGDRVYLRRIADRFGDVPGAVVPVFAVRDILSLFLHQRQQQGVSFLTYNAVLRNGLGLAERLDPIGKRAV